MQTFVQMLLVLGLLLPPAVVVVSIGVTLGSSFVYWLSHAAAGSSGRPALAIDHPVGR